MVGEDLAIKAAEKASENIVEFEGDFFREVKHGRKKVLVPIRVKVGINPLSLITAAAAALAGSLAATVAWHGVSFPGPTGPITLFKGIKETSFGNDLNEAYEKFKTRRQLLAAGVDPNLISDDPCTVSKAVHDAEGNPIFRERIREAARANGCAWAQ